MLLEIIKSDFKKAKIILDEAIELLELKYKSKQDVSKIKLLKARSNNPDFELELAEFICGDEPSDFPYRSSYYLTKFFTDLGFDYSHDGSTRRFWVQSVLLQMDITNISYVIEKGLFNRRDFRKSAKEKGKDEETCYNNSIKQFQNFINHSLENESGIKLQNLLDLNINTELLFNKEITTKDIELNNLIKEAKDRFYIPSDQKIALEKLWDAFERIKTYFESNKKKSSEKLVLIISEGFDKEIISNEFKLLTSIGNTFRIRHHETDKKELGDKKHITYLFFRLLSLIDLATNKINENEN